LITIQFTTSSKDRYKVLNYQADGRETSTFSRVF